MSRTLNEDENDPSEIHMAKAELMSLIKHSQKLYEMIDSISGLEGWVAAKITNASDYISSVTHWLEYEHQDKSCDCE